MDPSLLSNYSQIKFDQPVNDLHKEIFRFKTLKELDVFSREARSLKEVISLTVPIMIVLVTFFLVGLVVVAKVKFQDLAELVFAKNVRELDLRWTEGPSEEKNPSALKKGRHLRRWTYEKLPAIFLARFLAIERTSPFCTSWYAYLRPSPVN